MNLLLTIPIDTNKYKCNNIFINNRRIGINSMYTAEIMKSVNIGDSEVREVIKVNRSFYLSTLIDTYEYFYKSDDISICIYYLSNQQRNLVYQDGCK